VREAQYRIRSSTSFICPAQLTPDASWIPAAIQDPIDQHRILGINAVVYHVGKTLRKQAMKTEHHPVDATITCQGIDVVQKAVLKVVASSGSLELLKTVFILQIPQG